MAKNDTFTSFYYDDDNQKLAEMLFAFRNGKNKTETYAVEQMGIEGLNENTADMVEFVVEKTVETKYRQKKTDAWQSLEDFWTIDRMFAKSCPHWQRRAVSVKLGLRLRGDESPQAMIRTLVTWHTWYDNKYKSQADGIATMIVSDDYQSTAGKVQADWNDDCITNDMVQENALLNGFGIVSALSKHIDKANEDNRQKILASFKK